MKKFNFVIFPYRGMSFYNQYGLAVRDLQMIAAIIEADIVGKCVIIERPLSIYELIISGFKYSKKIKEGIKNSIFANDKVEIKQNISLDLIGPLMGRTWTKNCYLKEYELNSILDEAYDSDCVNIILDFTPIANINLVENSNWLYWYDLIDNFSKHNRFSQYQKSLVSKKYSNINKMASFVTGVSYGALESFDKGIIVKNAVGVSKQPNTDIFEDQKIYDFGFIGFITDKFDIDLLVFLSEKNHKIVLYGDFYDKKIRKLVSKIKNVTIKGKFHSSDIPEILKTFKVGLIPYLKDRMHDESPLKLYQYLHAGMPVLTSKQYDLEDLYIVDYSVIDINDLNFTLQNLLVSSNDIKVKNHIISLISKENFWDYKIKNILNVF